MAQPALKGMTIDEFLDWAGGEPDVTYELVYGQPRAMTGGTNAHRDVMGNVHFQIRQRLRAPCKVQVEAPITRDDRDDRYYVADAAISCASQKPDGRFFENPAVIVEILSESTAEHDRGTKVPDYMRIPSVQEILLVDSRAPRVQLWRRDGARWIVEDFADTATLPLASVGVDLPIPALYEGVAF